MIHTIIFTHIFSNTDLFSLVFCLWYDFVFISIETYTEVFKENRHIVQWYELSRLYKAQYIITYNNLYKTLISNHTCRHRNLFHQQGLTGKKKRKPFEY